MCGRFNLIDSAAVIQLMQDLGFNVEGLEPRFYESQYNIAPTDSVLVAAADRSGRFLRSMRWWLTPSWAPAISQQYSMFNARSETVEKSRAFARPFKERRCLIPSSGFIEWLRQEDGSRQPFYIKPPEGFSFMAGLWDVWTKEDYLESCTILTTAASESLKWLHHRMPVLLAAADIDVWLDHTAQKDSLLELMQPKDLDGWEAIPVSREINSGRKKIDAAVRAIDEARPL